MTGKEYFEGIGVKVVALDRLLEKINELREEATSLGGFAYDEPIVQGGSSHNHYEGAIDTLADLERQYVLDKAAIEEEIKQAYSALETLSKREYYKVLDLRYLRKKRHNWGWIAEEMGYSEDWVRHLCGEALSEFERLYLK